MNRDLSTNTAYGASAFATLAGYSVNEVVAIIGVVLAFGTFIVNWYYRHKMFQLAATKGMRNGPKNDDH